MGEKFETLNEKNKNKINVFGRFSCVKIVVEIGQALNNLIREFKELVV